MLARRRKGKVQPKNWNQSREDSIQRLHDALVVQEGLNRGLEHANQQLRQENNQLKAAAKSSEHSETIAELVRRVGDLEGEKT